MRCQSDVGIGHPRPAERVPGFELHGLFEVLQSLELRLGTAPMPPVATTQVSFMRGGINRPCIREGSLLRRAQSESDLRSDVACDLSYGQKSRA